MIQNIPVTQTTLIVMHIKSPNRLRFLFLIAAVAATAPATGYGQLIAYDGFIFPASTQLFGTTPGNGDGGSGWATTWSATGAALTRTTVLD